MSRIPNSAMPHAWAEDSEHAREVRRARGMTLRANCPFIRKYVENHDEYADLVS